MIENERKIVLSLSDGLEKKMYKMADCILFIEQGYLVRNKGLTLRIRKQRDEDKIKYIFTMKKKVGKKVIEIETKISEKDYKILSGEASGWVEKTRYVVGDWEVDFFKKINTYFVMAEIELDEDVEEPEYLPHFIEENMIYKVPRDDYRFSSKKLSNIEYAKKILEKISPTNDLDTDEAV